jgi:hypothetical protein
MVDPCKLNEALRPVAPPRVLEDVYTDDQLDRTLDVVKVDGPWPTITAHHFGAAVEALHPWPVTPEETLSRYVEDNELSWFTGVAAPEYW